MVREKKPSLDGKNLKIAREILFDIVNLFEKHQINYHLEGGTLLGIVRDHDLLPWDYDIDISIPESEVSKVSELRLDLLLRGYKFTKRKSQFDFGPIKKDHYSIFKVKPLLRYISHLVFPSALNNLIALDIFVKVADENYTYWQAKGKVMRVSNDYYKSFELVEYMGRQLRVPLNYRQYLTEKYGDWSVPVKEWDCGEHEGTIVK